VTILFPGCDASANAVLEAALMEARGLGHDYLGTEHLLLGFIQRRDLLPAEVARLLPADATLVRSALATAAGGPRRSQAVLLMLVGIDLDEVRSAVRRTFGAEAVESLRGRGVHQPWQPWKPWRRPSRRCASLLAGAINVLPRVKQAVQLARIEADRRGVDDITPAMLLLGMLEVEGSLANRLLRDVDVEPDIVLQALRSATA
jgi:ATP-dependent Clp protease ATP-binding subunit ClpA